MSVLQNILEQKRAEVEHARSLRPLHRLQELVAALPPPRHFRKALQGDDISLIAEIKKASPSRGILASEFHPAELAQEFERHGASALSVLTDVKFFQGDPAYVGVVKSVSLLPVLRKDFIIDEYQLYESRYLGADAILLIVGALRQDKLEQLYALAQSLRLGVLVEVHTRDEVERANALQADIIGINNRDLTTFGVSLATSFELKPLVHSGAVTVSESGIAAAEDVAKLRRAGFDAILVGEGLMVSANRGTTLKHLMGT